MCTRSGIRKKRDVAAVQVAFFDRKCTANLTLRKLKREIKHKCESTIIT